MQINQEVTLILPNKPGQKRINENSKVKREGVIKFINERFITIWIRAQNSKEGWNESFLIQDLGSLVLIQDVTANAQKFKMIS